MPKAFYDGTTGITPIDDTIKRILETGYCHHIERLMVLGGFMFLCEIDPDEIYKWFMEMFIDSYDWVMVPNVYAMSQNADGGLITTKPYFSGSNYIKKMSHYKTGDLADTWDALYWNWILKNADDLKKNHRWSMMVAMASKMDEEKKKNYKEVAEQYTKNLAA
jgi:deoxyribodipyrimidine photolyase-related protein